MKSKLKIAGFYLLLCILPVGVMPVQSTNLYVYTTTDAAPQSFALGIVQKLTFDASGLVVNKTDGTQASIPFTDLKCFSFRDDLYTTQSSIDISAFESETAVNVYPNPVQTDVVVTGDQPIIALSLYNIQGQQLLQLHPGVAQTTLSLAAYPAGIYLLQISTETGTAIKRIIKN